MKSAAVMSAAAGVLWCFFGDECFISRNWIRLRYGGNGAGKIFGR